MTVPRLPMSTTTVFNNGKVITEGVIHTLLESLVLVTLQ